MDYAFAVVSKPKPPQLPVRVVAGAVGGGGVGISGACLSLNFTHQGSFDQQYVWMGVVLIVSIVSKGASAFPRSFGGQ
jgi:hypothetical protein